MNMTPKLLGVFTQIYGSNDAMDFGKAALVAVVGFVTVIAILAIIALFIKAIAAIFDKTSKTAQAPVDPAPAAPAAPSVQPAQSGAAGATGATGAALLTEVITASLSLTSTSYFFPFNVTTYFIYLSSDNLMDLNASLSRLIPLR